MRIGLSAASAGGSLVFVGCRGRLGKSGAQRLVEAGQAFTVLGADGDRIAESKRVGIKRARFAGAPLALVGDHNRGLAGFAHEIGEAAIRRRRAGARIDQEQHGVRLRHGGRGLRLHLAGKALAGGVLKARGIDDAKRQIAELPLAFPPVARHAGLIVDKRPPRSDEAVEQRRFPDIGPTDDGDRERHKAICERTA